VQDLIFKSSWVWWQTLYSATWDVEIGGLQSEAGPDKSMRPYQKIKLKKTKGMGAWHMPSNSINS
jgi:hypothetical protein